MEEPSLIPKQNEPSECRRFDRELPLYLEGESGTSVERHAAQCAACRVELEELQAIRNVARQLPEEAPSPAAWANLRARLASEGLLQSPRPKGLSWLDKLALPSRLIPASAIAVLVVLGVLMVSSPHRQRTRRQVAESSSAGATPSMPNYAVEEVSVQNTVRQMEPAYRNQLGSLDPSVREDYQRSMDSLDHSIHECSETLEQTPDNSLARQYLMEAYAQKAALLASALEYRGR